MRKYYVEKKFATCYHTTVEANSLEEAMQITLVDVDEIPECAYVGKSQAESVEVSEALGEDMQTLDNWSDEEFRYKGKSLKRERQEWVEESMNAFLEEGLMGSKEE